MKTAIPGKYGPCPAIDLHDRQWPSRAITRPPVWCSVDLRDGNQALAEPMDVATKLRLFQALVRMGFREIEVGFPSASGTEHAFVRRLIEEDLIPEHVTIQVLTQARDELVARTVASIRGARRAIVHLYNSTSELQRRVVFGRNRAGIQAIAVAGARRVRDLAEGLRGTDVRLEYSPESFTGTEPDFALEVCEAVLDVWEPTADRPVTLNLPATVEMSTPNVYADRIEWFSRSVSRRDRVVLSVHPHNDRGTAVAAAELALLAGAERVEGTLFGNGERTGNVDIVTLALNMFSQGIDPGLELHDVQSVARVAEECTGLPVHARHPYAGELVFTAFSGSHQDAIRKGFAAMRAGGGPRWEVPYLPIDPADVGRTYEAVVRINSQSGKGGVAYVLETRYGLRLPKGLQVELGRLAKEIADSSGEELRPEALFEAFEAEYLGRPGAPAPLELIGHGCVQDRTAAPGVAMAFTVRLRGEEREIRGCGNGPLDAFADALRRELGVEARILDYSEHAVGEGSAAEAVAYVELAGAGGSSVFGAGRDGSIVTASLRALASAVSRAGLAGRAKAAPAFPGTGI
ncbi:MAG: 2-isopropylmalate synthase [Planctomycetes bacterium]|nr:2-isopropylmalate synthase [Planctomycetota bacterium]